jgi:hypothetical protein
LTTGSFDFIFAFHVIAFDFASLDGNHRDSARRPATWRGTAAPGRSLFDLFEKLLSLPTPPTGPR